MFTPHCICSCECWQLSQTPCFITYRNSAQRYVLSPVKNNCTKIFFSLKGEVLGGWGSLAWNIFIHEEPWTVPLRALYSQGRDPLGEIGSQ